MLDVSDYGFLFSGGTASAAVTCSNALTFFNSK